jgi:hypothetical protein
LPTHVDLALEDSALDYQTIHDEWISAVAEAVTYRQMLTVALALLSERQIRCDRQEQRLRQILGSEPWHQEQA